MEAVQRQNQPDCVTQEELARLFDEAFAEWSASDQGDDNRRHTPRITLQDVKPIIVVCYTHEDRTVELNGAARILDISADGMGVLWAQPLPVAARVRFALGSGDGQENQDVATVQRSTNREDGYHIGLTFVGDAASLEAETPDDTVGTASVPAEGWRGRCDLVKNALLAAYRVVTRREAARQEVRRSVGGSEGLFVVEAKLFRFIASLYIDGRKIADQTGRLNNRIGNLFSDSAPPTMINLEGGDFSAWAMLRANAVTYCNLDLSLPCKHRLCMSVLGVG